MPRPNSYKAPKRTRSPQLDLLKKQSSAYGGELMKTRKGRMGPRPLASRQTLHLVLRSTKAKGEWSFRRREHQVKIKAIVKKFSGKYGVKVISMANVGNHLHFHIKLSKLRLYKPFIRAITSAIAMAVTGASRWRPLKKQPQDRFWDYRPFTRVVQSFRAYLNLRDYIKINQWEGRGVSRIQARFMICKGEIVFGSG